VLGLASAAADAGDVDAARRHLQEAESVMRQAVELVGSQPDDVSRFPPRVLGALVWGKLGEGQEAERVLKGTEGVPVESILTEKDVEEVMEEVKGGKERIVRPDGLERELTRACLSNELRKMGMYLRLQMLQKQKKKE
jgi:hypothetical protein